MKIITKNISALEFIELRDYMRNCLDESIKCVNDSLAHISWYETCEMEDYFAQWQEIWDEDDTYIGDGLDTISNKFVINEDTREDFVNAFNDARDEAYEEAYKDFSEDVHDQVTEYEPYPEDDPRSYDLEKWASDGEYNSVFIDEDGTRYYKIKEDANDESSCVIISFDDDGLIIRH